MKGIRFIKNIVDIEKLKRLPQISFKKLKKTCPRVFFMKLQTNSHVNIVSLLFFTQEFSNTTICLAVLVLNQIHNNFHFHEVFSQNNLSKKLKD